MNKPDKDYLSEPPPWMDWTREDSEELVRRYIMDYFRTLDEYFLNEAVQIAREDSVNLERIMRQVRFLQS